ncbi:hypothetical protein HYPSUDRAFT_200053 [Hypholoma sublateritium FD-334 SS-4]|uniref:Uncharacterized protein n=1 Tax=Hypholoma sublateritium (strain FD-334 SS-4) TaxID=945553 RepID=A0A0D2MMK4_HYPSF|nr:hypothetical protein HYPSUDRAFT_200053 [Hypholoma sublateritium FD-334 SS-4]
MSATPQVSLIIDDTVKSHFEFPSSTVAPSFVPLSVFYGSSAEMPGPSLEGTTATFVNILFDGTSIMLYGNVSQQIENMSMIVDGANPIPFNYDGPRRYGLFFELPTLAAGPHNVTLSNVTDVSIDFAVISANLSAGIASQLPIIIDDSDQTDIIYTGQGWTSLTEGEQSNFLVLNSQPGTDATPYNDSVHTTSGIGDGFNFTFIGNDLTIYGIMNWTAIGSLSLRFALNGSSDDQDYAVVVDDVQFSQGLTQPNFPWYQTPSNLAAGQYTLVVEVLQCQNLPFTVDYITYLPSSLSSIPGSSVSTGGPSSTKSFIVAGIREHPNFSSKKGCSKSHLDYTSAISTIVFVRTLGDAPLNRSELPATISTLPPRVPAHESSIPSMPQSVVSRYIFPSNVSEPPKLVRAWRGDGSASSGTTTTSCDS